MKGLYNILTSLIASDISDSETATTDFPRCQQGTLWSNDISYFFYECPLSDPAVGLMLPDLSINVDFGPLAVIAQSYVRPQLPLLIGLSNSSLDDYAHTVPVTFIPGVNMAAAYILGIRQIYTDGVLLATLGMFEVSMSLY